MSAGRVSEWLDRHDGKDIVVVDDNFTLDKARVFEVAEHLRREKLALSFSFGNGIRINTVDREMLATLKRMNTVSLAYGVESIHDDVLHALRKGQTRQMIENATALTRKVGIPFHVFMIIGLPGDTYDKTLEALEWVCHHVLKAYWNIACPYPNTMLHSWVSTHGRWLINPEDYGDYGGHFTKVKILFDTEAFPRHTLLKALNRCLETAPYRRGPLRGLAVKMGGRKVKQLLREDWCIAEPLRRFLFGKPRGLQVEEEHR